MAESSTVHPPKFRSPLSDPGVPDTTARMSNAGLATLVSLGYADAGRRDADAVYAAMVAADDRRTAGAEDDFVELRAALAKASRAPWRHDPDHQMMIGSRHALIRGTGQSTIFGVVDKGRDDGSAADAAFAALARNHLPALLAAYDALRSKHGDPGTAFDEGEAA